MSDFSDILSKVQFTDNDYNVEEKIKDGPMPWKKFCLTGRLEGYTRSDIVKILGDEYEYQTRISQDTEALVVTSNASKKSAKYKKAKEMGIKIVGEDEFMQIVTEKLLK